VMLVGSTGLLEIAMNRSRADTHLGVQAGDELAVEPLGSGSMRGRGQGRGQHTRVAPRKANR
jgi:hypothetical protein